MVDADLILEKLAFVETCVEDLRRLARPALIETDLRIVRDVLEHRLGDLLAFVDALRAALARDADAR